MNLRWRPKRACSAGLVSPALVQLQQGEAADIASDTNNRLLDLVLLRVAQVFFKISVPCGERVKHNRVLGCDRRLRAADSINVAEFSDGASRRAGVHSLRQVPEVCGRGRAALGIGARGWEAQARWWRVPGGFVCLRDEVELRGEHRHG
jgi:hypothetical protein